MSALNKETLFRVLSALVTLPVLVYIFITDDFRSIPILIGSIVISLISLYEYYRIADRREEGSAFVKTGLFFGLIFNITMYIFAYGKLYGDMGYFGEYNARVILAILALFVAVVLVLQLLKRPLKGGTYSMAITIFGVLYIVMSISHFILLKSLNDGAYYIMTLIVAVMMNDSGAYFGGVLFGKHKIGLEASPNKSKEGYLSGILFSLLAFILINQIFVSFFSREFFSILESVILGIVISVLANIGDLVESAVKRDGGIKDSGSIIPGHGGMWDVFDATMFALPFFYYYLVLKGIS